ncbi:MAG: tagatose-bisphosphate aldolase [Candidatus Colwellbacteria bacterium CG10_big_fil_rev_8_21_14_0_10_42_22]|uniref:Tagatose-bisphosphate aldolase n=1 Tax=Candidatus Colwellbacteria bacterium CG10_big_fil_rev_8_21_14_0_10_42_22 TaxID=1974540 RepID=A0A2H0VGN0_9BACT|nr:MAG: tagatose-bisphosphate aldolase [Candidatus Colwellbacteria bacterium CG10_big_fil_rev_8_21_14_0_10_42_22]
MKTLRAALEWAKEREVALGHFNTSDIAAFHGITKAAKELGVPVIIGTSEGEAEFIDLNVAVSMVLDARKELDHPIFLNADHFRSLEKIKEAVVAGYDAVIFDVASEGLEENINKTKEAVGLVKRIDKDVFVEGELGYIGKSSKILEEVPEGAVVSGDALPTVEEVKRFVEETGVDLVAPAVGNLHGMFKNTPNPELDIELIRSIGKSIGVPMVLHGGSGISDEDFRSAIEAGIRIIHINTELRVAWRKGIEGALEDKTQVAPYKVFPASEEGVYEVVKDRLKLFNGML